MKVSIAIPHFNNKQILGDNLPNILSSGADEVLIIDDRSSDQSVEFIKEHFPKVILLENLQNRGFIFSVNRLFNEAIGDIVVLLNNDVFVEKDFLKPLIDHFSSNNVFAVNCHEEGERWSEALWKDGFYQYKRGQGKERLHKSAWASGGSAAFKKKIWQDLNGFDPVYFPGYWEDVDISFRALKQGYDIYWEPNAKVKHRHGTTMEKVFKKRKIDWIRQRNQLLFVWKNISDPKLKNDHRSYLLKRLFGRMGLGYWIPYLWAQSLKSDIKRETGQIRTDLEAINYASS